MPHGVQNKLVGGPDSSFILSNCIVMGTLSATYGSTSLLECMLALQAVLLHTWQWRATLSCTTLIAFPRLCAPLPHPSP